MSPVMVARTNNVVDISQWKQTIVADMSESEFRQWAELLAQRTGIALPESRRSFLVTSLNIRMRELGFENYQVYFDYLLSGHEGNIEWETLVDRLTVHETRFFRDQNGLELIKEVYLKGLQSDEERKQSLNLWSVGCATGEETYSLAIEVDNFIKNSGKNFFYSVIGSDISSVAIAKAHSALYRSNRLSNVSEYFLVHYFDKQDENTYRVKDFIQKRVCFNQLNLLNLANNKIGLMDIIYCQNVLIYFKREQRIQILNSLVEHLKPNGLLILGAGEIHGWAHPEIESVPFESTLAFRRLPEQEIEA
jgi:type IV pilus assembly protein PilK